MPSDGQPALAESLAQAVKEPRLVVTTDGGAILALALNCEHGPAVHLLHLFGLLTRQYGRPDGPAGLRQYRQHQKAQAQPAALALEPGLSG